MTEYTSLQRSFWSLKLALRTSLNAI